MSNQENEIYLENKREEFEQILQDKAWEKVLPLYIEMEHLGFSYEVIGLSKQMTDEDAADYKRWDIMTNGDTETQTGEDEIINDDVFLINNMTNPIEQKYKFEDKNIVERMDIIFLQIKELKKLLDDEYMAVKNNKLTE